MDFFGSFMFILQTILLWAGVLDTKGDALLATSILLIMLRAIGDMRCFEKTRYLVKLIIEVFKDMESFFYILVHSLVSFAVAYYCLSSDRSSRNFWEEIGGMYRLTYGDFAYVDDYGVFEWTFFVVSTLIVPLVMMNLLIAIISDSFERVYSNKLSYDFQVKCSLVLETENLLFWRRNRPAY